MIKSAARGRIHSPDAALDKALVHLHNAGLDATLKRVGMAFPTYVCILRDSRDGKLLNSGYGKGIPGNPLGSMVGSVMEAIEHHYTDFTNMDCEIEVLSAGSASLSIFKGDRPIDVILESPDVSMAMRKYTDLQKKGECWWPLVLSSPYYYTTSENKISGDEYDYSIIRRYTTNSGTAAGFGIDEAIVHATNELIERDALSLLLIGLYLLEEPVRLKIVARTSLTPVLSAHLQTAETELGLPIVLIDITSDIPIPTYLAVPRYDKRGGFTQFGAGSSEDAEYAAERAITELCQLAHLVDDKNFKGEELILTGNFRDYPKLAQCAQFDLGKFIETNQWNSVNFRRAETCGNSPTAQLDTLKKTLLTHGIKIFYSINAQFDNGLCVVSVVCPKLERFNLVLYGNVVLPGERGLSALPDLQTL